MNSSDDLFDLTVSLLSTLRRLEIRLQLLGSLPDQTLRSLYQYMTQEEKDEVIGTMLTARHELGSLCDKFCKIDHSERFSKTDCTILPFSIDQSGSK